MRGGIAAWQRVERVFQDIERENQLILRAAGEGIYGVNAEGKTTFVNPAAERMLGWTRRGTGRQATCIRSCTTPIPTAAHYPDDDCPIYAAFRDGAVHQVDNEVFWRKDGTPFWVEYTSTPIRDRGTRGRRRDRVPRRHPAARGRREAARRARRGRPPARAAGAGERLSAGRNPHREQSPRHHRPERRDPEDAAPGRAGRADRRHRADHRRVRHRQGADRARHPRGQQRAATGR